MYNGGKEFEIEAILDVRGAPDHRFYYVRWAPQANGRPWPKDNETWKRASDLSNCKDLLSRFWASRPDLDPQGAHKHDGEHRCKWCGRNYTREQDLKTHWSKKVSNGGCRDIPRESTQHRPQSKSWKVTTRMKRVEAQQQLEPVKLGETKLKWVYDFPYLGHHFQADGDAMHAVEVRLGMASACFGKLHHIWSSSELPLSTKLQLYASGVCSILTHAHEAWKLNAATMRKLNGWNGRNLAIMTKDWMENPSDPELYRDLIRLQTKQPTWDLVATLRVRRLQWVGHILRQKESSLLRRVLLHFNTIYPEGYPEGSLLMDAPKHDSVSELIALAGDHTDHTEWNLIVKALQEHIS